MWPCLVRDDLKILFVNYCNFLCLIKIDIIPYIAKPGTIQNLKTSEMSSSSCYLSWEPPADTGGAEISAYIVEKREADRKAWTKVSN